MPKKKAIPLDETKLMRPAISPRARLQQLSALAYDVIEQRLRDGTVTSQETTALLRYGSPKARLEEEILELNKELIAAKTQAIKAEESKEKLYADAIRAMGIYSGQDHVEN